MNFKSSDKEKHPNIKILNHLIAQHKVSVKVSKDVFLGDRKDFPLATLTMDGQSFKIYVDDEYNDFKYNNPILNFCLVLRELEDYKFSDDYLVWCAERYINPSDIKIRDYYSGLDKIYADVTAIMGVVKSYIPDTDFEFAMGEVVVLRKQHK